MARKELTQPNRGDREIIEKIEGLVGRELKQVRKIVWNTKGYTVNDAGEVVGLGLFFFEIDNKKLQTLAETLGTFGSLTTLYLGYNKLTDVSALGTLTSLTDLNLGYNKLTDVSALGTLTSLTDLNLGGNKLTDVSKLGTLTSLTRLDLNHNQLAELPKLGTLTSLTSLDLYDNQLTDVSKLEALTSLTRLDLSKNQIKNIAREFFEREWDVAWKNEYGFKGLNLYGNPLEVPPVEVARRGRRAVLNYFRQMAEQEEDYLFEAKMLILGEPGAGKTSMAWKIEDADCELPDEDDTTKGIDVRQYYFPLRREDFPGFKQPEKLAGRQFRVNLWDFGGQDIYKATHRFFLSRRSLYALVADSRNEDTDFNYWLHIVEMFGEESPLLIVLNEKYQRKRSIDKTALQKRFDNIVEVIEVDFDEGDKGRLEQLKRAVRYYISGLDHIGSPVPAKWTVVREALKQDERNTISRQDYLRICKDNGIGKDEDALVLSQYFHDIGVFLHFQDDELLNKTIFLKPNWATHAVYKVLDDDLLNRKNGRFDKEDAKVIWSGEEYLLIRDELLKLMQRFFLAYEIEGSGEYMAPERLQPERPKYEWDGRDNLFLHYEYDFFMPKGIMSLFIVRMNHYICEHDWVWKRGVVLEREETRAEIIETYDSRSIKIRVAGKNKRDFMTIIAEEIDRINGQYEKMNVEKMIPCNCEKCKKDQAPYFFEYQKLKRRLNNQINEIECENSYKKVYIRGLIDEVMDEEKFTMGEREPEDQGRMRDRKKRADRDDLDEGIHIENSKVVIKTGLNIERVDKMTQEKTINKGKTINIGNGSTINAPLVVADQIENSFNTVAESDIKGELKELLHKLINEVNEAAKAVPEETAESMARDVESLSKELVSSKPRRKWYEMSIEGLKEAAGAVGEVGKPILKTVSTLLPMLKSIFG
jgi:GTPase SAR1 family protein